MRVRGVRVFKDECARLAREFPATRWSVSFVPSALRAPPRTEFPPSLTLLPLDAAMKAIRRILGGDTTTTAVTEEDKRINEEYKKFNIETNDIVLDCRKKRELWRDPPPDMRPTEARKFRRFKKEVYNAIMKMEETVADLHRRRPREDKYFAQYFVDNFQRRIGNRFGMDIFDRENSSEPPPRPMPEHLINRSP